MRVFIVHKDVPYEFGEVWGVFLTRAEAQMFIVTIGAPSMNELSIEEWETEGNVKC